MKRKTNNPQFDEVFYFEVKNFSVIFAFSSGKALINQMFLSDLAALGIVSVYPGFISGSFTLKCLQKSSINSH